MTTFAALQSTYTCLELALFAEEELLVSTAIDKHAASKMLIPAFDESLAQCGLALKDLAFIAVNQGPSPFTTLRTVISTANGLAWAAKIPLIGISGLHALADEYETHSCLVVALLNAFCEDVYFGIAREHTFETGCMPHALFIEKLQKEGSEQPILFVGNAAQHYEQKLKEVLGERAQFVAEKPQTVSIAYIAHMGLHAWRAGERGCDQLLPLYLKKPMLFQRA